MFAECLRETFFSRLAVFAENVDLKSEKSLKRKCNFLSLNDLVHFRLHVWIMK